MKIRSKIILLLSISFSLICTFLILSSLIILDQSNQSSIDSFRNELLEHTNELISNNAKIFFQLVDAKLSAGEYSKTELLQLLIDVDPMGWNILIVDRDKSDVFNRFRRTILSNLLNEKRSENYWQEMLTTQKRNFVIDNYSEVFSDQLLKLEPLQIHIRVYPEQRLIIGYGKVLSVLKLRIKYLQKNEKKNFQKSILLSISLGLVVFFVTLIIAYRSTDKSILRPLNQLSLVVLEMKKGNLATKADVQSNDELGHLANAFNAMADQLNNMVNELESKVLHRTKHLATAKAEAELANSAKSEFLANISHELRNPMHHILSYSKSGVEKFSTAKPEKLLHYFKQISISAGRLMTLLNDLLDFSKMEAGKMDYRFEKHDIWNIVKDAVDELQQSIDDKGQQLALSRSVTDLNAVCDLFKIGQLVRNVISNAIKFTPEGKKIRVQISKEENSRSNPNLESIRVSIGDEGVGIPEEEVNSIFDKFNQSSRTKTGAGGTGLGLSICYEIIKAHGGEIWAENNPDGGALFSFTLPYNQETA